MAGDGDVPPPHQGYLGFGYVNGMAIDDIALHQTEIIEPKHRRLSVPAEAVCLLHRRLQQMHMDHHAAALVGFVTHTAQERLACTVRPAGREQDARVVVVVGIVKLIEETEIGVRERLLIKNHERACFDPQIGGRVSMNSSPPITSLLSSRTPGENASLIPADRYVLIAICTRLAPSTPSSSKPLWCSSVQPLRRWRSAHIAAVNSGGRTGMYAQSKRAFSRKSLRTSFWIGERPRPWL